jgi:membrane protease YdiL (CAAX protease family)
VPNTESTIQAAPPKAGPSGRTQVAAWLLILIVVSFLVVRNQRNISSANDNLARGLRMKLIAQEAIAVNASFLANSDSKTRVSSLIQLIANEAREPDERLDAAILAGYIQGPSAMEKYAAGPARNTPAVMADLDVIRTIYDKGTAGLNDTDRERLITRHGYFADLALASGSMADPQARKSIESSAQRILVSVVAMAVGLLVLFLTSIALLVAAVVCWRNGRLRRHLAVPSGSDAVYVEAFAIYLVLFIAIALAASLFNVASLNWNWLAWLILPVVITWIARRSRISGDWRAALGWYSGSGWFREVGAGIAGYVACIPFIAVGLAISAILIRVTGTTPSSSIIRYLHGNMLGLYAIVCVYAPVLEETMFRGALFHYLRGRWSWPMSAALVSLIFAMIHPQGWVAVPALAGIAMVLAGLREWRGTLIAPMAAHAFNNFIAISVALAFFR